MAYFSIGTRLTCTSALTADGPALLVADTYNHKIKRLDPQRREMRTLLGAGGAGGHADGTGWEARFSEPGGLAVARGALFVADTNNHALRVVGLSRHEVTTMAIDESRRAHPAHPEKADG